MSWTISGGCACGRVRYESEGTIEFSFHCHCRKCQRATGAGHASAFALSTTEVTLTGELKYFEQLADSGSATYAGFCPNCGSPILSRTERFPERLYFHAATLDSPADFDPTFIVCADSAQPWDPIDTRLSEPKP